MRKSVQCLRCHTTMQYIANKKIQLGQTGWLLGDLPNLIAGAMEAAIYTCPSCGKIEFFQSENTASAGTIAQQKCPACGKSHDMDYPKCPFCKHDYFV